MNPFEDWFLPTHLKRITIEGIIDKAIDLMNERSYDEAIKCLHQCLESTPAGEPFMGLYVAAIIYLGLAHIHKNEYEIAIKALSKIPRGISVREQQIPLDAIEIFLVMGHEAIVSNDYGKAEMIYHGVISVTVCQPLKVDALIGAFIARYKKEKKSLSWLKTCIKDINLPLSEHPWLPFEIWAKRLMKCGKGSKSKQLIESAVEELTIAKYICEVQPNGRNKQYLLKINKCLAKLCCKLKKSGEAIKLLEACSKMEKDFYINFWKSQENKGKEEKGRNLDKTLERFTLLSHITTKMPGSDGWKKRIINFHLRFGRLMIEKQLFEEAINHLDNIKEYLQHYQEHDENLAEEIKQFGNILTRKKEHSMAKRLYSYALEIVPQKCATLKRDLFSNRSYMNELLGNYSGALSDAKKCLEMFPKWPKGHLRLGRAYLCQKEYRRSFNAFSECYKLSTSEDRHKVLERLLTTKFSTGNEGQRNSMVLPKDIAFDVVNSCVALLVSDGSKVALDSLNYLLLQQEYSSEIKAQAICLASLMQKNAPAEMLLSLIERGANLTDNPSALDVFIERANVSQQNNEVLLRLIEKGADVSKYINVVNGEPWQHTLVRLCVKLDKLDALSEIIQSADFEVTDNRGNNVLHVLTKMNYSNIVFNCMKLVTKRFRINPKSANSNGKKPADLIKDKNDERVTFLEELEKTGGRVEGSKKKNKRKKNKKRKGTEVAINEPEINGATEEALPAVDDNVDDEEPFEAEAEEKPQLDENRSSKNRTEYILHLIEVFVQAVPDDRPPDTVNEAESTLRTEGHVEVPLDKDCEIADDGLDDDYSDKEVETYNGDTFQDISEEFEGLPWDVQCTAEFWKKLQDTKLESSMKLIILRKVKLLASGDWRRRLASKIEGPPGIRLYKARLTKGARMIWEEAIAFSERRSADKAVNWGENCFVYTDVIRLWDFTLDHDAVQRLVSKVSTAYTRGQSSTVTKSLKVKSGPKQQDDKRLPRLYHHANQSVTDHRYLPSQKGSGKNNQLFFPPASPNDREFHILKFYALSNAMAKCLLQSTGQNFDFPFQVSELEHRIIRLTTEPAASILLLGRSGTGKTTCCLYRLWSKFKGYWENAVTAGAHIPVLQRLIEVESNEGETLEENNTAETVEGSTELPGDNRAKMSCGCRGTCMCVIAAARANYANIDEDGDATKSDLQAVGEERSIVTSVSENDEKSIESGDNDSQYRHLRQLFITKNKVLCHEVKKNFRDLCNGLSVVNEHVSHFSEEAVGNLDKIDDLSYPLFLGSRDLLLALDATLPGKPFFARLPNGKLLVPVAGWGEKESHLSFLPVSDSEEEDDTEEENVDEVEGDHEVKNLKAKRRTTSVKREITYTVFVHEVWPEMEKKSLSGYHPSLVWTEFCSFIKGTVESLVSNNGYMSEEEYHSVGRKKAPNFLGDRNAIYDMFKRYRKICVTKNLFDEFDFLHNIYKRLRSHPIQPWLFDEIYVDETQDFTEAELFLLIRCCQDPNQLFFTGDTAQSIMRGVTFRFSDLRSLFFNAKNALSTVKKSPIEVPKEVHQLKYNYRSHKGILKLASSIVHLLGYFFPESFDRLDDDVGMFDGPKPVILETSDFAELALVLRGARRKTSHIEFGAHQVVLVSSEKSKEDLPEELRCALVLTIYESKGLEFDDVLLYNFFKDSQAEKEWRVVNNFLDTPACKNALGNENNDTGGVGMVSKGVSELSFDSQPLAFDHNKHKILNSELKQLYTALTRARVNVWIYDEDRGKRAPMFNYFDKLGLVEVLKLDRRADGTVADKGMFAEESSAADWEKQGQYFYRKELWNVAYKCFEKTQNETMLRRCEAHLQAMNAYKMGMEWRKRREAGSLKSVHEEYVKATEYYLKCGMGEEAAICLKNAKKWKLLGELLWKLGRFREAGRYFAKAASSAKDGKDDNAVRASESFIKVGDYRSATDVLYKNEKYKDCIRVMKEYEYARRHSMRRLQPPRSTLSVEIIVKEAVDTCVKRKDLSHVKEYMSVLPIDNQLDYLRKKPGCEDIALEILIESGRAEEAAEIYMRKGRFLKAASCSNVDVTKGICFLEQARLIYSATVDDDQSTAENSMQNVIRYLNMAAPCLGDDPENLADCYFMIGMINKNQQFVKYAADEFAKCGNYVGVLLCNMNLWDVGDIASDVIVESLAKMLHFVGWKSGDKMKMLQAYFGIEKVVGNDGEVYFRINEAKFEILLQRLAKNNVHLGDFRIPFNNQEEEEEGNRCILNVALSMADKMVGELMDLYQNELRNNAICLEFLQGISHNDCQLEHSCPTLKTIQDRCNVYCAILQMHGLLRDRMAPILKDVKFKEQTKGFVFLTRYSDQEMVETCHFFYQDLTYFTQYLSSKQCSGQSLIRSLPDMSFLKEQIMWCVQKMWKQAGDEGKFSNMNLFFEVFILSTYAGVRFVQYEVDNIREEIKQRYRSVKMPPKSEIAMLNKREFRYETFHTMFMDSKSWMHDEGCLIESMHVLLRRALGLVLRKDVPLPSLTHSLILLEFCLSLCLISLSRTNRDFEIHVPEFYIEGIHFWSGCYQSCFNAKYSAYDNIDCVAFMKGNNLVKNLVSFILDLLSGVKFDLFHQAFGDIDLLQSDLKHRADAERFLILVLVLLGNHRLYSDNPSSARPICLSLRKFARMERRAPGFILQALDSASRVNSPENALTVVRKILQQSGRALLNTNWGNLHKLYCSDVAYEEKPKTVKRPPKEEKTPRINKEHPTVIQSPIDENVALQKKHDDEDAGVEIKINSSAAMQNEGFNYFLQDSKDKDSKAEGKVQNENEQKADFLRGISYDDDNFEEMRDNEATVKATVKRHNVTHSAACKIQLWWRIVYAIRASKMREQEKLTNENKIEEHCRNYARDLFCIPCGRRYGSRDELYKHILKEESHDHAVSDYNKFISYKKSVVDIWLKKAEDLLDQEVMGRPIAEQQELAGLLNEPLADISFSLNFIEKTYRWAKLESLKNSVTKLQSAYMKLEEQVSKLVDDHTVNDDNYQKDFLEADDFQVVSRKKGKKSHYKTQRAGGKRR